MLFSSAARSGLLIFKSYRKLSDVYTKDNLFLFFFGKIRRPSSKKEKKITLTFIKLYKRNIFSLAPFAYTHRWKKKIIIIKDTSNTKRSDKKEHFAKKKIRKSKKGAR